MKIVKAFFLLACLTITFAAQANDQPEARYTVKTEIVNGNEMIYQLINLQQQTTSVSIKSLDGKTSYLQEHITKRNGFRKKVHIGALKAGRYIFEVEQAGNIKQQVIVVQDQKIWLSGITD